MVSDRGRPARATEERTFYLSAPAPCPYLAGQTERRLVTFLEGADPTGLLDRLNVAGFRRSQAMAYRPICPGCSACVPVRIPVATFRPSRNLRKLVARNAELVVEERPKRATEEQYDLFRRYLASRHPEGGMAEMNFDDYRGMVEDDPVDGCVAEFRQDGRLVAGCLTDHLPGGLSGVYKFFEPEPVGRSLGTYVVLWLVERARTLDLPHVYLGYWIGQSPKMAYKARFRPLERLGPRGWEAFDPAV